MNEKVLKELKPWIMKPFQFLYHAEMHYRDLSDYGKRFSFINFDNSIEVSIFTFMYLNVGNKGLKIYKEADINNVKNNFYRKLEVFENYIIDKKLPIFWDKERINYYHQQRNFQYHDALLSTPDTMELNTIRNIALWVFSVLFEITDVESLLQSAISESEKTFPSIPIQLAIPDQNDLPKNLEKSLFIASILGGWNENSSGDLEIIEEVANEF